ncbi:vasoactive intestinal polypeptide receptor 2 [Protopterus annectens]|uniref:vasoactive intestinal polypeptide receptor 2 n=1 Tax=Protopterus annectens TaxID=7888 RepID=UPI001CFAC27E|nr:vasoactive intestinal polypeptide receptor 2 [Protopterus annectens]
MRYILMTVVTSCFIVYVSGRHSVCGVVSVLQEEKKKCLAVINKHEAESTKGPGCGGEWDNLTCWRPAEIGETVLNPCPKLFKDLYNSKGNISRNCTLSGWSDIFPPLLIACDYSNSKETETMMLFYTRVQVIYTLGHSVSLIALTTGSIILCFFRRLHCTRNYIHLNLFISFILRAVSVLVKDQILYSTSNPYESEQCSVNTLSWVACKTSLVFFQYCIMANFFWLLVEGLYLLTLLVVIFTENRHFILYLLLGWGIPTIFVFTWSLTRIYLEDTGCWDTNDHIVPWWLIKGPILFSISVNFIIFLCIIRILVQKLSSADVGGNDQSQYKRLAKSTLLLIPLFGVYYIVFAFSPPHSVLAKYQIQFELCVGSFQGLIVAVLYCFLNSEVQTEIKRKWRTICLDQYIRRNYRQHSSSISRNGSESVTIHRDSRMHSSVQSETSSI